LRRLFRFARNLLAALGALTVLITCTPVLKWWTLELARPWNEPKGDVLIVLVGSTVGDGMLGESSYWRSVYAVRAWRAGGFRKLLLTGGEEGAGAMRSFLIGQGVPAASIVLETHSGSTRDNACNTKTLLQGERGTLVLMTSDYHMFRAYRAFRKCGVEVTASPLPDALKRQENWWLRWPVFGEVAVETVKAVYYAARGWI
jgi:uncharacterized SAM-binding protein YcdF (DUF218 family)